MIKDADFLRLCSIVGAVSKEINETPLDHCQSVDWIEVHKRLSEASARAFELAVEVDRVRRKGR